MNDGSQESPSPSSLSLCYFIVIVDVSLLQTMKAAVEAGMN